MQDEQPGQDTSPAQPVGGEPLSADAPPSETPATPAPEEADVASGQPQEAPSSSADGADTSDIAPDSDEPGDDVAPEELEQHAQDAPNQPDNVDQEG